MLSASEPDDQEPDPTRCLDEPHSRGAPRVRLPVRACCIPSALSVISPDPSPSVDGVSQPFKLDGTSEAEAELQLRSHRGCLPRASCSCKRSSRAVRCVGGRAVLCCWCCCRCWRACCWRAAALLSRRMPPACAARVPCGAALRWPERTHRRAPRIPFLRSSFHPPSASARPCASLLSHRAHPHPIRPRTSLAVRPPLAVQCAAAA